VLDLFEIAPDARRIAIALDGVIAAAGAVAR
jgi:hypothetical protein